MDVKNYRKWKVVTLFIVTLFLCVALGLTSASAQEPEEVSGLTSESAQNPDKPSFFIEPYLWLPAIGGELQFTPPTGSTGNPGISVDPDDYFSNLEMGFLLTAGMRKGKWSLTGDFIYMDISGSSSTLKDIDFGGSAVSTSLNINSELELKTFVTTFGGGYQIVDTDRLKMDLIAGLRYLWLEAEMNANFSGTITGPGGGEEPFNRTVGYKGDKDFWNGIGGIRGKILIDDSNLYIPFYADMGAGDSEFTWQFFAALGYTLSDWCDVVVGYRYLDFRNDDDALVKDLNMGGPVIGFNFKF